MSCLNISIEHLHNPIKAATQRIDKLTSLVCAAGENIQVSTQKLKAQLQGITASITDSITVNINVVCSLSDFYYMDVSPGDIQWITDDTGVFYDVESNVNWIIITD